MIPPHLKLARELELLLHELAPDARTDAEFFALLLPRVHVQALEVLGRPHVLRRLEELRDATEPREVPSEAVPKCWRVSVCNFRAVSERWYADDGTWRPVCADHARAALPMELRKIPFGTRLVARPRVA